MNRRFALFLLLLCAIPSCQAQPAPLPHNYKTILTNRAFRVITVHYGPHEKVPVHSHSDSPTVYVYLNNSGPVRFIHEAPEPVSIVRPPSQEGAFRISAGRIERHSVENLSDLDSRFLRVELLNLQLDDKTLEFRGKAPADDSHNLSKTEFSSPQLAVTRTICLNPTPCTIAPSDMTAILVAISDTIISNNGHPTTLKAGSVIAVAPHNGLLISPSSSEPAHILQILVPFQKATKP
jgi:hypothetical protein